MTEPQGGKDMDVYLFSMEQCHPDTYAHPPGGEEHDENVPNMILFKKLHLKKDGSDRIDHELQWTESLKALRQGGGGGGGGASDDDRAIKEVRVKLVPKEIVVRNADNKFEKRLVYEPRVENVGTEEEQRAFYEGKAATATTSSSSLVALRQEWAWTPTPAPAAVVNNNSQDSDSDVVIIEEDDDGGNDSDVVMIEDKDKDVDSDDTEPYVENISDDSEDESEAANLNNNMKNEAKASIKNNEASVSMNINGMNSTAYGGEHQGITTFDNPTPPHSNFTAPPMPFANNNSTSDYFWNLWKKPENDDFLVPNGNLASTSAWIPNGVVPELPGWCSNVRPQPQPQPPPYPMDYYSYYPPRPSATATVTSNYSSFKMQDDDESTASETSVDEVKVSTSSMPTPFPPGFSNTMTSYPTTAPTASDVKLLQNPSCTTPSSGPWEQKGWLQSFGGITITTSAPPITTTSKMYNVVRISDNKVVPSTLPSSSFTSICGNQARVATLLGPAIPNSVAAASASLVRAPPPPPPLKRVPDASRNNNAKVTLLSLVRPTRAAAPLAIQGSSSSWPLKNETSTVVVKNPNSLLPSLLTGPTTGTTLTLTYHHAAAAARNSTTTSSTSSSSAAAICSTSGWDEEDVKDVKLFQSPVKTAATPAPQQTKGRGSNKNNTTVASKSRAARAPPIPPPAATSTTTSEFNPSIMIKQEVQIKLEPLEFGERPRPPFTCPMCKNIYSSLCILRRHIKTHDGHIKCDVGDCGCTYTNQASLTKHKWNAHGIQSASRRRSAANKPAAVVRPDSPDTTTVDAPAPPTTPVPKYKGLPAPSTMLDLPPPGTPPMPVLTPVMPGRRQQGEHSNSSSPPVLATGGGGCVSVIGEAKERGTSISIPLTALVKMEPLTPGKQQCPLYKVVGRGTVTWGSPNYNQPQLMPEQGQGQKRPSTAPSQSSSAHVEQRLKVRRSSVSTSTPVVQVVRPGTTAPAATATSSSSFPSTSSPSFLMSVYPPSSTFPMQNQTQRQQIIPSIMIRSRGRGAAVQEGISGGSVLTLTRTVIPPTPNDNNLSTQSNTNTPTPTPRRSRARKPPKSKKSSSDNSTQT